MAVGIVVWMRQHEPVTIRKIIGVALAVFSIFLLGQDEPDEDRR